MSSADHSKITSALCAEVAVQRPVGRLLDYALPEGVNAQIGCRVLVPLGNSRATGMILAIKTPSKDQKLKPILDLLDQTPVLDSALVKTLRFAIGWYRSEPADALRSALPAGLSIGMVKTLLRRPNEPLPLEFFHLEPEFENKGQIEAKSLDDKSLVRLLKSGAVETQTKASKSKPEPRIEWLRARIHPDEFPARAKAQHALLETLYKLGDWQPVSALERRPGMRRLLRALAAKNAIEIDWRSWVDQSLTTRDQPLKLNDQQRATVDAVSSARGFSQHLIFGITGSGKTEVYMQAIKSVLDQGKQALVLVPEIALTPQMVRRFAARFGDQIAVLHSAMSDGARRSAWYRAQRGEAAVVIGARSAVFASMPRLGLVVVDEEHDSSYKQSDRFRYHGRDLVIYRAKQEGIPVVLGSATPSLETYHRAQTGQHTTHLHRLDQRATGATLPAIQVVDLRHKSEYPLSKALCQAIDETLARGEQIMLLLNRRGWAPTVMCLDCGHRHQCSDCSVPMVVHRNRRSICHWCGLMQPAPTRCPDCNSSALSDTGVGTQQLETACRERFPKARVARLDSDTARSTQRLEKILGSMADGEIDLLVGTQMLAKGHDLPGVTLVGVICADQGLRIPDPRCSERSFALLTQVAGRAGRAERPGRVLFQTFDPDHRAIQAAVNYDAPGFLADELQQREALGLPPFRRAVMIRCEHEEAQRAQSLSAELASYRLSGVEIFGPIPAAIERLRGRYRFQVMATSKTARSLQAWLDGIATSCANGRRAGVRIAIDVDPAELI